MTGIRVRISGRVQGVGFRPTVWRLAHDLGLQGRVANSVEGVVIELRCRKDADALADSLLRNCPPLARIDSVTIEEGVRVEPFADGFQIVPSDHSASSRPTDVAPDAAICPECLADLRGHQPRRLRYWLTNCTHCGPRFSITRTLPYDRPNTSMVQFPMCRDCEAEYTSPTNRRYHAQPIACPECGPLYSHTPEYAASVIASGGILMLKGVGGYSLICDARNHEAISRLRILKHRPRKPFAVMGATPEAFPVVLSDPERESLQSWRAPIVVAPLKEDTCLPCNLAPGVATLGVMLPSMGFHHALLEALGSGALVVVTSANFPGCPIIADDNEAAKYAAQNSLPCVSYNRLIHNRVDDSVVRLVGDEVRPLRRARGFTPDPLSGAAGRNIDGFLAMGADIVGGIAIGRGSDIIPGQFLGSLHSEGGEEFLHESVENLLNLYRMERVSRVVVDCHPDYVSTHIGRELAAKYGAELVEVQHHHAHALAVMAEHRLDDPVGALVLDGTGWGPDGTVWGSELLLSSRDGYQRLAHGPQLRMPGGNSAAREPWRMAAALAHSLGYGPEILPDRLRSAFSGSLPPLWLMMERSINSPLTSGAGRLWDAVAALAGIAYTNSYEAEAPLMLEGLCRGVTPSGYHPVSFAQLLDDLLHTHHPQRLAMMLHEGYAAVWVDQIAALGLDRVALCGGVMANALLVKLLTEGLSRRGITPLLPRMLPAGDGAIASGQLYFRS